MCFRSSYLQQGNIVLNYLNHFSSASGFTYGGPRIFFNHSLPQRFDISEWYLLMQIIYGYLRTLPHFICMLNPHLVIWPEFHIFIYQSTVCEYCGNYLDGSVYFPWTSLVSKIGWSDLEAHVKKDRWPMRSRKLHVRWVSCPVNNRVSPQGWSRGKNSLSNGVVEGGLLSFSVK